MQVITVETGILAANNYIVSADGVNAVLIDCGAEPKKIENALQVNGLTVRAVLLTHGHFDHCGAAKYFQDKGAAVYMHSADVRLLTCDDNLAYTVGEKFASFAPDFLMDDGQEIFFFGLKIQVLHTPGHTAGGLCFLVNDEALFSGDTLFYLSVGRTDFPGGNAAQLLCSVKEKLFVLKKNYAIYPGHDRPTRLFFERDNNFYV